MSQFPIASFFAFLLGVFPGYSYIRAETEQKSEI